MTAREFAIDVVCRLQDAGYEALWAGGCVRDELMSHPSNDIDIATSASVEEIQALFPKTIPVGVAFGIVIVVEGGHHFEVATFRKESGYLDGRRPTSIERATPQEDAQRRDFTINGMFWDPLTQTLHDFVGGQEDLQRKVIRAIGDPHERFLEDRLRMMRAARYATRFGFCIELATERAIISHAQSLLPAVAMERVWQEFKKMAQWGHLDAGLIKLHELHLLSVIFPSLHDLSMHAIQHRLLPLKAFPAQAPAICALLELFPSETLEQLETLCERLKLSSAEKESVEFLTHAKQLSNMPQGWHLEPFEWVTFYANPHAHISLEIIAAHLQEREAFLDSHRKRQQELFSHIERRILKIPLVRAEHLIQEGIPPGKHLGILLQEAEKLTINHNLDNKEAVILLLKKSSLWHN